MDEFIRYGRILFRSLSYYRDYEDAQIRGDELEGTRRFRPKDGLTITKTGSNESLLLPHSFESTTKEDDIFVHCLSTELSPELALKFGTRICVEILEPDLFLTRIRYAIPPRFSRKAKQFIHGPVIYYQEHEPPVIDWALPEKIAMAKPQVFAWQNEYRLTFPIRNAFKVENVQIRLVPPGERRKPRSANHPRRQIELGCLSKLCKIWHFD